MFAGLGYDVHRFAAGRKLVLGGVHIQHEKGLDGHSDADVLIHALMDALLGAAGMPDIGNLFPNTDPAYRGASSLALLKDVAERLTAEGYAVNNVDVTVVAERPKIMALVPEMKRNIADALGIAPGRVGIKATTNETMGFIGRGEGIAAMAVASVASIRPADATGDTAS